MNLPVNNDFYNFSYVHIHVHKTCLILNIDGKNHLYKFAECNQLISKLKEYVNDEYIEKAKQYIFDNNLNVIWDDKKNNNDQLSLF